MPFAYILLTYGPRHGIELSSHPAAQVQGRHIRAFPPKGTQLIWCSDYARRARGLEDLPVLKRTLEHLGSPGMPTSLLVSDLSLLFKHATPEGRLTLADALHEHAERIIDVSRQALLSAMPPAMVRAIIQHGALRDTQSNPVPRRSRPHLATSDHTAEAAAASRRARSAQADGKARELQELRAKIAATNGIAPNHTALASEANRRGLLTTRNKPWTASTVGRTLRRLQGAP
ncbi:hypothetical protein [Limimaricola hongkongensis]|uniref:hypothetical protein n=1 Tax=Limimaricola hongkongensis TaxID=278132 RepID=UPI000A47FAFA|nr:hypothetical protein [Limimaricola hongkongensis]